jgi:hypothetical protein
MGLFVHGVLRCGYGFEFDSLWFGHDRFWIWLNDLRVLLHSFRDVFNCRRVKHYSFGVRFLCRGGF